MVSVDRSLISSVTCFREDTKDVDRERAETSWRVAAVGYVIPRDPGMRGELVLIAFVRTTDGAWFMTAVGMAGRPGLHGPEPRPGLQSPTRLDFRQFTAIDDRGGSYHFRLRAGFGVGAVQLRPDPPHELRWLDLSTTAGEPAARLDLDPPCPGTGCHSDLEGNQPR